jgi:hypothetical protein
VTVDYQIRIESGGVTITQHVDAAVSSGGTQSHAVRGTLTILGNSFAASKAANAAAQGGVPAGSLGPGGIPAGSLGPGGIPAGSLGPGGNSDPSASGQIAIFGPVVIDVAGLVHKSLTGQTSQEKKEN